MSDLSSMPAIVHRRRCEGFPGQRMVALPAEVVASARRHALLQGLLPTKIGFFPTATGHLHECKAKTERVAFMLCTKGRGWCEIRGQMHEVGAGSLVLSPPGELYAHGADTHDPWTVSWFQVVGDRVGPILGELGLSPDRPVITMGDNPQWPMLFEEALGTLEQGLDMANLIHSAHALGHLLSSTLWRLQKAPAASDPRGQIARCVEFMKQHLDKPLRLDALARMANMSAASFKSHFKQYVGQSCIEHLIHLRVERACALLETTDLSVKTIADRVGYGDPLWFSKAFRAVTRQPPSEYRLQRRTDVRRDGAIEHLPPLEFRVRRGG